MLITELDPTQFHLPGGKVVQIATERWAFEPWKDGPDPLDLPRTWARKPKFSVNGRRSCAELAILAYLQSLGWDGVWVSAFARELRRDWFPTPGFKTLHDVGAPAWALEIFNRLLLANGGRLSGFFDVFAWRGGNVRFDEAKGRNDRVRESQHRFVEMALRLGHRLDEFTIIKVHAGDSRY
jgi:hypothetical protein